MDKPIIIEASWRRALWWDPGTTWLEALPAWINLIELSYEQKWTLNKRTPVSTRIYGVVSEEWLTILMLKYPQLLFTIVHE